MTHNYLAYSESQETIEPTEALAYNYIMSFHAVDFGTSNSLLSYISKNGSITSVPLEPNGSKVLRSLLYTPEKNKWYFGMKAIDEYTLHEGEGRFFRSIKKFLPEPNYIGTEVFNRKMNISDLVAVFLGELRTRANEYTKSSVEKIVLGRPALYSLDKDHDRIAQDRMQSAAIQAGYKEVHFCPEPIAAGLDYRSYTGEEKIVLIADFGGGTSDFTLMKVHQGEYSQKDILGLSGIFVAGDALDGVMMKDFIAPHFGSQFEYQLPGGKNVLTFPRNLLKKICSPAHITHLRERDTWEFLQHINKFALSNEDKNKMENLFSLVEMQLGFPLFHEIEITKIRLTQKESTEFSYQNYPIDITQLISSEAYMISILPSINEIVNSMNEIFIQSSLTPSEVDQVILTGGTSQFPLIKKTLINIFGKEKISEHNIYQSVVNGLAKYTAANLNH